MMKRCVSCGESLPSGREAACPRCGKSCGSNFWGMSEEEQAHYVKKMARAVRDRTLRCPGSKQPGDAAAPALGQGPVDSAEGFESRGKALVRIEPGRMPLPDPPRLEWKEPVTGMEFVAVRAGCYWMGAGEWDGEGHPHEKPVHEVRVDAFWLGKYPVTQEEWHRIMGSNPSHFKRGDRYPVECVSWLDVGQFIKRLTARHEGGNCFRLPTEAEWEYACRSGGRREKYAGGETAGGWDGPAWHAGNSGGMPHPVGARRPNGLDLYDMSGNVWEWCEDIYDDSAYDRHERSNPVCRAGEPDRVIRGGSWYSDVSCARCSSRGFLDQTFRRHYVGFRLVRVPVDEGGKANRITSR